MAYYLDLFDGDPEANGTSVLEAITGSATRPNVTSDMTLIGAPQYRLANTATLTISSASDSVTNISWVALYDAPTDGTRLFNRRLGASPTINEGYPVQFNALSLTFPSGQTIRLSARLNTTAYLAATLTGTIPAGAMATESDVVMITEDGAIMVTQA